MRPYLHTAYNWVVQFLDPLRAAQGLQNLGVYLKDWYRYTHLPGTEPVRLINSWPQLHDRTPKTPFDPHYFWTSGWAIRRIIARQPKRHIDIGSQVTFVNLLSAVVPVVFVDYRPLEAPVMGLTSCGGDILRLPFANGIAESLSCLHVAEHIGLGRYGDSLNPSGTRQACAELQRVLAQEGNLYFALPVGRPRVCFNAHRIHGAQTIVEYFDGLTLIGFSSVSTDGRFVEQADLDAFNDSRYACGLFWFKKI